VTAAIGATEDAIVCTVSDRTCIEEARADGEELVIVDGEGNPIAHENAPGQNAVAPPADAATPGVPGEGVWANYDFVPGERVLFYEDFAGDTVGRFPQRLEFRAGTMEIVEWEGERYLRSTDTRSRFHIPLPETLPDRATMEFDLVLTGGSSSDRLVVLTDPEIRAHRRGQNPAFQVAHWGTGIDGPRPSLTPQQDLRDRPVAVRIALDGDYAMLYIDERRVGNVPAADFRRTDAIAVLLASSRGPTYLSNIRIAAGGTPLADALLADGRVTTQGILFDTGSARIRPESTPTLKEIADALRQHGNLRLRIEGHTDSVGQAPANQRLSEQRAQAVVAHLVEREGVAAGRLEAAGMGQEQPVADNGTAEGRAQNRRVELVVLD
jgi:OmpA-OmpF porin, OOP family